MKSSSNFNEQNILAGLEEVDWSFPSATNSGLHSVHWYPATYVAAIPGSIIPHVTAPGETVLDPFCGSGTTGVEAIRLGRRFVGIDTNPVGILISEAKLKFVAPTRLLAALKVILDNSLSLFASSALSKHPHEQELRQWYHSGTLHELNAMLREILKVNDRLLRRTLLAIFSAVLKSCSSQGRHWGWVCDNVKPKPGEIAYKNARLTFENAVVSFAEASDNAFRECKDHTPGITRVEARRQSVLFQGSCIERFDSMSPESVDAIVTSPPYYGVADYVKSQRLTYLWFDLDHLAEDRLGFRDFEALRSTEAGARSNRHRLNSHALYMSFMDDFFAGSAQILKSDGLVCLVVGESSKRASTTDLLIDLAAKHSLKLEARVGRDIKNNRRRLMASLKGEEILFLTKNPMAGCR